jgi:sugar lactone lactonase YvrE
VVRIDPSTREVERYVQTGGRPLGMAFDRKGRLYIADGTRGLLRVEEWTPPDPTAAAPAVYEGNPSGVGSEPPPPRYARLVATCELPGDRRPPSRELERPEREPERARDPRKPGFVPGLQPYYTDSVAITTHEEQTPTGKQEIEEVWFTCPSQRWSLAAITLDALEGVPTGRVLRYVPCEQKDPTTCEKTLVADGLMFANGIAVETAAQKMWVSEWYGYRITTLTPAAGGRREALWTASHFVENLPGFPDNLSLGPDGTLWVGLVIRRIPIVDRLHPYPLFEKVLARLPDVAVPSSHAFAVGFDGTGKLVHNLQDTTGVFDQVTGVYPSGDALYLTSNNADAIACLGKPGVGSDVHPCGWRRPPRP